MARIDELRLLAKVARLYYEGGLRQAEITKRLKAFVNEPVVTVTVASFRSQPISILGSVTNAGVHQLQGRKTLFEVISMAEGLRQDAGNSIKITRRKEWGPIPLPTAKADSTGEFFVAEVSVKSVLEAKNLRLST